VFLVREIESELGRAHRIDGIERCHPMVAFMPALVPLPRIHTKKKHPGEFA